MNKTVIVFTTKYIGNEYLFSKERSIKISVPENCPALISFWGEQIVKYYKELGYSLPSYLLNDFSPLIGCNGEISQECYDRFFSLNENDMKQVAVLCEHWPFQNKEDYMTVYKLGQDENQNNNIEIYAASHLPNNCDSRDSLRKKKWIEALKRTFKKDDQCRLYLIMHGSSDLNQPGHFHIIDTTDPGVYLAGFYHEPESDRIAELLTKVPKKELDIVKYIYDHVIHLFHVEKQKLKACEIINLLMTDSFSENILCLYKELYNIETLFSLPSLETFQNLSVFERVDIMKKYYLNLLSL